MERTEGTIPVFPGLLELDAQMEFGIVDDRIEISYGLDVVVGWHGGIIGKYGLDCQDGFAIIKGGG